MNLPFVPLRLSCRGLPEVTPLMAHAVVFDASFVTWDSVRLLRGQRHRDTMVLAALGAVESWSSVDARILNVIYQFPSRVRWFLEISSEDDL